MSHCSSTKCEKKNQCISSCPNWNHPEIRNQINNLVDQFGPPCYDINLPDGLLFWKNVGIFNSVFLEDTLINHCTLCKHNDSLSGSFILYIKPEYLNQLMLVDPSFGYQGTSFQMTITCKNIRWITGISYVILRYLDSLDFPEKTRPFSIEEARSLLVSILNIIDCDSKLYVSLQRKINKYLRRNNCKYCDIIYKS